MAAFSSLTLCKKTDIESEMRDLTSYTQVPNGESETLISEAIGWGKEKIRKKLLPRVQDIFSNSHSTQSFDVFVQSNGWTLDTLDGALDLIHNPSELTEVNVAYAIVNLITGQINQLRSSQSEDYEFLVKEREYWKCECKSRMEDALRLLKFDLSNDGTITPDERTRTHNTFFAV